MELSRKEIEKRKEEMEEEIRDLLDQKHNEMKGEGMPPAYEIDVEMYPVHVEGGDTDYTVDNVEITLDTHWDRFGGKGTSRDE